MRSLRPRRFPSGSRSGLSPALFQLKMKLFYRALRNQNRFLYFRPCIGSKTFDCLDSMEKTKMPKSKEHFKPETLEVSDAIQKSQNSMKNFYDQLPKSKSELAADGSVLVLNNNKRTTVQIVKKLEYLPRSYIVYTALGQTLKRNSSFLRKLMSCITCAISLLTG